jgi:phenylacetate-coenzyme A ligase PaaK-like adenylate-forming protein
MSSATAFTPPQYALQPFVVGRYFDADGNRQPLAYSTLELERARHAMVRLLRSFHFQTGSNVLVTSMFDESAQLMAAERAIQSCGMVVVSADATLFDANRVESIARRFKLAAALGISADTLAGLKASGHDPATVFANMVIWARPDAYEELKAVPSLNVLRWQALGPAVALECQRGNGMHFDRHEWHIEEENGELLVSSLLQRSQSFMRMRTGVRGHVETSVCGCGNLDPRIVLE